MLFSNFSTIRECCCSLDTFLPSSRNSSTKSIAPWKVHWNETWRTEFANQFFVFWILLDGKTTTAHWLSSIMQDIVFTTSDSNPFGDSNSTHYVSHLQHDVHDGFPWLVFPEKIETSATPVRLKLAKAPVNIVRHPSPFLNWVAFKCLLHQN